MALIVTAADIALVRSHVGYDDTDPTDTLIITTVQDTGSPLAAGARLVRARVTVLLSQAAKTSLDGEFSEDWSANLTALRAMADRLDQQVLDAAAALTGQPGYQARRISRPGVR